MSKQLLDLVNNPLKYVAQTTLYKIKMSLRGNCFQRYTAVILELTTTTGSLKWKCHTFPLSSQAAKVRLLTKSAHLLSKLSLPRLCQKLGILSIVKHIFLAHV
jgi:hypothetical protein